MKSDLPDATVFPKFIFSNRLFRSLSPFFQRALLSPGVPSLSFPRQRKLWRLPSLTLAGQSSQPHSSSCIFPAGPPSLPALAQASRVDSVPTPADAPWKDDYSLSGLGLLLKLFLLSHLLWDSWSPVWVVLPYVRIHVTLHACHCRCSPPPAHWLVSCLFLQGTLRWVRTKPMSSLSLRGFILR